MHRRILAVTHTRATPPCTPALHARGCRTLARACAFSLPTGVLPQVSLQPTGSRSLSTTRMHSHTLAVTIPPPLPPCAPACKGCRTLACGCACSLLTGFFFWLTRKGPKKEACQQTRCADIRWHWPHTQLCLWPFPCLYTPRSPPLRPYMQGVAGHCLCDCAFSLPTGFLPR
jgi:hypothetical protein